MDIALRVPSCEAERLRTAVLRFEEFRPARDRQPPSGGWRVDDDGRVAMARFASVEACHEFSAFWAAFRREQAPWRPQRLAP